MPDKVFYISFIFFFVIYATLLYVVKRRVQNRYQEKKEKLSREIAELKRENSERIQELKEDKKILNENFAAILEKAKFGSNLSISWQNCKIDSSEIDSKAIFQGQIEMQAEYDAKMIKELEEKLKNIKTILTKKIESGLKEGKYRPGTDFREAVPHSCPAGLEQKFEELSRPVPCLSLISSTRKRNNLSNVSP